VWKAEIQRETEIEKTRKGGGRQKILGEKRRQERGWKAEYTVERLR
jgi:hypothetical protein